MIDPQLKSCLCFYKKYVFNLLRFVYSLMDLKSKLTSLLNSIFFSTTKHPHNTTTFAWQCPIKIVPPKLDFNKYAFRSTEKTPLQQKVK